MSQFQITPNIGIQVTATEILLYFLSSLTLNQSFNDGGKVTHMDIFFLENKFEYLNQIKIIYFLTYLESGYDSTTCSNSNQFNFGSTNPSDGRQFSLEEQMIGFIIKTLG